MIENICFQLLALLRYKAVNSGRLWRTRSSLHGSDGLDVVAIGKTAMQRRDFITLVGGALAASVQLCGRAARAQQGALPEIGVLNSIEVGPIKDRADAFFEGLEDPLRRRPQRHG